VTSASPHTFTVELADRSYPIHFGRGLAPTIRAQAEALLEQDRRYVCVSDRTLQALHFAFLEKAALTADGPRRNAPAFLEAGEQTKSIESLETLYARFAAAGIDRQGAIFAFGGGVIGDLAGFAAASWLRGVDFYQIPTTLLAMVDSSVGGKNGINTPAGKNLVGAFWQPQAVYIDLDLLHTLPAREFAAGMAEVIKYGLLNDAELFARLEKAGALAAASPELEEIVRRCCAIKAGIVAEDERESAGSGGRALLNLGHTFAHAIEKVAGYGDYLHGEAVAIGLVLAARLSERLGCIGESDTQRITRVLRTNKLPTALRAPLEADALLAAMRQDKKARAGRLRFVTLERIGKAVTADEVPEETVRALWQSVQPAR
jgi:3-dehydroquinate synthase